jgi:hypothetical protein
MTSDELLNMAEQQILGFTAAMRGDGIVNLIEAMGLTYHEWEEVKKDTSLYMREEDIETLDEHFLSQ